MTICQNFRHLVKFLCQKEVTIVCKIHFSDEKQTGDNMRKVFSFVVMLLFLTTVAAVSSVYALGVANSTHTATVTIPDTLGAFEWDIVLKKVSDNSAATQITWNTSDITIGGNDKWFDSDVYAVITTTLTRADSKIEIYQDNVNSTVYKATTTYGANGTDEAYNGLVLSTTSAGTANGVRADLPFAWRVSTNTKNTADLTTVFPPEYSGATLVKGIEGQYFLDIRDTGYATAADKIAYRTVFNKDGARYGGGINEMGGSPTGTFYMYFGANFEKAMGGMTYGSDRIILRGYQE
jgi:hypothetical protein